MPLRYVTLILSQKRIRKNFRASVGFTKYGDVTAISTNGPVASSACCNVPRGQDNSIWLPNICTAMEARG